MGQGHCQGELRPGCDLRPAQAPCAPPSVSQPRQTVLRSPTPPSVSVPTVGTAPWPFRAHSAPLADGWSYRKVRCRECLGGHGGAYRPASRLWGRLSGALALLSCCTEQPSGARGGTRDPSQGSGGSQNERPSSHLGAPGRSRCSRPAGSTCLLFAPGVSCPASLPVSQKRRGASGLRVMMVELDPPEEERPFSSSDLIPLSLKKKICF